MAVKVLVSSVGQHIIADTKQIENKESNEVVGYWLSNPRVIVYNRQEDGNVSVGFVNYCLVSDEAEFSLKADHVVAILEPREDVQFKYSELINPEGTISTDEVAPVIDPAEVEDESSADPTPVGA